MRVHLIGLCGVGMSATALLLKEKGYGVTGSDAEAYGPPVAILEKGGIRPILGYSPDNIPDDVDCFVIGRNAKLSPEDNAEVRAAHETGKPIYSFPEMLGELTRDRTNVVVAGSYGKSTTTSLIAHILRHAGVRAGYFIGAEPVSLPAPAELGSASLFVVEGDEYPSAHDDSRSKFMHLHPQDLVLTAVVHDHVNVFPTFEDYQKPFRDLLALLSKESRVVVCSDEPNALALANDSGASVVTYGIEHGDYRAIDIRIGETTHFTLIGPDSLSLELSTTQLGRHNIEDIVGACAYILSRKLLSTDALQAGVASFGGVRRRLDNIAPTSKVPVFEGFGSSYEKARAAIEAIQLHFPDKRLVLVFEPHTFGWRNRANLSWYDDVFAGSQLVFIAPPETQGADTHAQLSHEEIMDRVSATGVSTVTYDVENPGRVVDQLAEGDVVLILTSGSLEGTLELFGRQVAERFS
ncbi:MAG: Mur ligase family protein [Patescibacteria group bacterium]